MMVSAVRAVTALGISAGGLLLGAGPAGAAAAGCEEINGSLEEVTRVSGNSFTTSTGTYRFDSNDEFAFGVEGDVATYSQFRKALAVGTEVQLFTYCRDSSDKSGIALANVAGARPDANDDDDETPRGGVEAGAGGMADPSSPVLPATGALAGTLLIGAGVAAARRRTS